MPAGKLVRIGAWERDYFIGCILFSSSASPWLGSPYGLTQFQTCELVRVALRKHEAPVSRMVSIALRLLRRQSPGLRLVVSYADPEQGHVGGIYQAGGWVYDGRSAPKWTANGQHNRAFGTSVKKARQRFGADVRIKTHAAKYRYLMPLDRDMREQIAPLAKPYPKKPCAGSVDGDASVNHTGEGGSIPTPAL